MAKRPEDRYGSAGELAAAAAAALGEPAPDLPRRQPDQPRPRRRRRRRRDGCAEPPAAACRSRSERWRRSPRPRRPGPWCSRRRWLGRAGAGRATAGGRRRSRSERAPPASPWVAINVWVASTGAACRRRHRSRHRARRPARSPSGAAGLGRGRLRLGLGRRITAPTRSCGSIPRSARRSRSESGSGTSPPTSPSATGGYGSRTGAATPCRGWIPRPTGSTQPSRSATAPGRSRPGRAAVWVANIDDKSVSRSILGRRARSATRSRSASGRATWRSATARSG